MPAALCQTSRPRSRPDHVQITLSADGERIARHRIVLPRGAGPLGVIGTRVASGAKPTRPPGSAPSTRGLLHPRPLPHAAYPMEGIASPLFDL